MRKTKKIILSIIAAAALVGLIILCIPLVKLLCTEDGRAVLDNKVKSFGSLAPLTFIFIEIIQIVAAFIPGAPVEVMSGVLFGGFWGVVWCIAGVLIGTVIVFFLVRKFGRPLVYKLFPQEKLDAVKILNDEKRLILTVFILFVIPGTPKDFLTYIAGLTKIKTSHFFATAVLARIPSLTCSVLMGANLGNGRFLISIILLVIIIAASLIGYFIKNRILGSK